MTVNKEFTLRGKIDEAKADYLNRYGVLDWHWFDEGLVYTIQDYHSSKGSLLDFTADDLAVCSENGLTLEELAWFCDEQDYEEESKDLVRLPRKYKVVRLHFPVDGYRYNVQILTSIDNGRTYYYCGQGRYCKTIHDCLEYIRQVKEEAAK